MNTILVLASLVLVGAAGADEGCGGTTTAEGITAIEGAKRYRAQHECMMRLAERQNVTGSGTGQVTYPEEQTACLPKMQAAMEAMDEFVNPSTSYSTYDGCNTCTFANGGGMCTTLACTGRNEVALAEWELKKAKERAVVAERRQKAHEQWTEAKACWRKP